MCGREGLIVGGSAAPARCKYEGAIKADAAAPDNCKNFRLVTMFPPNKVFYFVDSFRLTGAAVNHIQTLEHNACMKVGVEHAGFLF
jgi:hypothetical protein